jgi:hypothetical protein
MVRSTAISWKIGVAVTAVALPLWQLPALADDGATREVETRAEPLKPKAVPITLLPAATDTQLDSWRRWLPEGAPIIMVRPAPAKNTAIAPPRPEQIEAAPIMAQPAENAAIIPMRPEQVEAALMMEQPAENTAIVQPRQEPEKIQGATRIETPSLPERPRRVAMLPPVSNAIIASSRPELAKTQNDAPSVAIPSLPGRSPFRQAPFKSEIVESGPKAPEPPKGSAASRFFANLWPGNKGASTPVSVTGEGRPLSANEGKASLAEAGPKSDTPPVKRFLDGIQFWKN